MEQRGIHYDLKSNTVLIKKVTIGAKRDRVGVKRDTIGAKRNTVGIKYVGVIEEQYRFRTRTNGETV